MSNPASVAPRRVPDVGQVLTLAPDDWRYHDGTRHLTIRVAGVRDELSHWYGGDWVWIEGHEVERPWEEPPGYRLQALIRVAAIPGGGDEEAPSAVQEPAVQKPATQQPAPTSEAESKLIAEAVRLCREGRTVPEIGAALFIPYPRVRGWLVEQGIIPG